jgi:mono/diheme cytochrome c family protein
MKTIIKKNMSKSVLPFILAGTLMIFISFTLPQDATKWIAPASAEKDINPIAKSEQSIAAAKILFTKNCEQCHGKKGRGDGPKSAELEKQVGDMTTADFAKQSDGALYWKITQGRKPMPSFKKEMTDEQRWNVILYVRELGKPKAKK